MTTKELTRSEKEAIIMEEMWEIRKRPDLPKWTVYVRSWEYAYLPLYPNHILMRAEKSWWNMVFNNFWTVMFNMSWTHKVEWSYKKFNRDLSKDLYWQSDETIYALYDLIQKVKWIEKKNTK